MPSPSVNRRQPLLHNRSTSSSFAEVAGGTTAECAAVCCCCPCGLVNLLFVAIYKVPVGICRRVIKEKRRKRLIKKGLVLPPRRSRRCKCGCDIELQVHPFENIVSDGNSEAETEKEVMKLEKEMWERFYGTGFWRSSSQRESLSDHT